MTWVVVAYHRPEELERLLATVASAVDDVVVVNVEDAADVREVARRHRAAVVGFAGNPGFAAAVNAGVAAARDDVIVVSNDDVVVSRAVAASLESALSDGVDVVVPALVDAAGARELTIAALPTPWTLLKEWAAFPDRPVERLRALNVEKWRDPKIPEAIESAAATVFVTRADLLRSTPMPEAYFLYWEEAEWFWRLRERGCRVEFRPELQVQHLGGRADVRPDKSRLLARNAVRVVRRTQGRARAAAAYPIVILWQLRLVAIAAIGWSARRRAPVLRARVAGLLAAAASWREVAA